MGGGACEAPREVTSCATRQCVCGGTLLHRSTFCGAMAVCKGGTLASRWPCDGSGHWVQSANGTRELLLSARPQLQRVCVLHNTRCRNSHATRYSLLTI
eukprot:2610599-Prymnesium_polylepis.1